ncbi:type II toxin-antitoxin system VapB family antitoxin [Methylobacterium sp. J-026]|uniref:type II toxin-antitoxin system VapB family antitoxin n=1 Tax=Methylobacterium sp. J-026 TaxID=2836624 RepID=UPI001FBB9FAC|nr:type II toxin-antitoxin system VapB family antitoxin [Methylobacterium sp. J-026]MCJ2137666.1 type II toxin-antitoxin system VapB family antitoxin [Methylobacterium sp. J-026]
MSIIIENAEVEALLTDLAAETRQPAPDLLLALLRRERKRLRDDGGRRIAQGLAADEAMRRGLNASPLADPRPIDEILAYDEQGLPT